MTSLKETNLSFPLSYIETDFLSILDLAVQTRLASEFTELGLNVNLVSACQAPGNFKLFLLK